MKRPWDALHNPPARSIWLPASLTGALLAAIAIAGSAAPPSEAAPTLQGALAMLQAGALEASAAAAELTATDPHAPQPRAWVIAAAARQRRREYGEAARAYRAFLEVCEPGPARDYAARQLAVCSAGDPAGRVAEPPSRGLSLGRRAQLSRAAEQTSLAEGEHFIVESHNAELSALVLDQAERSLRRIAGVIGGGAEYPHVVRIRVHVDGQQYRQAVQSESVVEGSAAFELTTDESGFAVRVIHLRQLDDSGLFDPDLLDRALPHELCHLVAAEYFGDASCPRYLQEGLAMLAESAQQDDRVLLAGTLVAADRAAPLETLLTTERIDPARIDAWYAQAYSFIAFLHQRLTDQQFAAMLAHVKSGCSIADALHRSLNMPPQDDFIARLERAWQSQALAEAQVLSALQESTGGG